ncbi:MAG: hypothetical protein NWF01_03915 [Candidatus Bathyarchaeota archaeon]|nr:hypothetical protein [Candidatus Bathyarchaeota archaeon]
MDNRVKIGLIVSVIAFAAVLSAVWALTTLQPPQFPGPGDHRSELVAGDLEVFYLTYAVISTINIVLLVILVLNFVSIYRKTRSPFTVGLVIFAGAFLIKDITANPLVIGMFRFQPSGLGPFVFLPGIFELMALSALLYLSIKY